MAETTPNNVSAAPPPPSPRDAESNKPATNKNEPKKIVRLLTVVAYMMSVSMAAMMLSAYYIFLWNPKEHRVTPLRLTDPCPDCYLPAAGGVNHHQMNQFPAQPPIYNESQMAETPRVLPAQEHLPAPTTPLSRLVQRDQDANYTEPELVHS